MRQIDCAHVLTGNAVANNQAIEIDGERIHSLHARAGTSKPRLLAMPALVNAHDHGRVEAGLDRAVTEALERGGLHREVGRRIQPAQALGDGLGDARVVGPERGVTLEQPRRPALVGRLLRERIEQGLLVGRQPDRHPRGHQRPSMVARSMASTLSSRRWWRGSPLKVARR